MRSSKDRCARTELPFEIDCSEVALRSARLDILGGTLSADRVGRGRGRTGVACVRAGCSGRYVLDDVERSRGALGSTHELYSGGTGDEDEE